MTPAPVPRRPSAVLAMRPELVQRLFDRPAVDRLTCLTDVDPSLVVGDPATPAARRALRDVELLVTGWGCPPLDHSFLAAAPRLRAVVHIAGTIRNHVTDACWDRPLAVSSAAAANAVPVAEYTLAMILLAQKHVLESARLYRTERRRVDWGDHDPRAGNYRRTVGILSASAVGRRVIELLRPHDLDVQLYDPYLDERAATELGVRLVELRELFATSDTVSVHTPLLPETRGLVSGGLLAVMADGGTLINTARGAVVDQRALTDELLSGRLHAVLDVTDPEPLPADSPLFDCPNVLLTPHVAGSTGGELLRMTALALDEIERYARGLGFAHPVRRDDLARIA